MMNMQLFNFLQKGVFMLVSGFCPVQQDDYYINVYYIDVSTFEERQFVKSTFRCEHNLFGDKCNGNECPIYKSAPKHKR